MTPMTHSINPNNGNDDEYRYDDDDDDEDDDDGSSGGGDGGSNAGDDDNTNITLKALHGDDGKDESDDDSMYKRETHLCRLLDDGQAKLRVDGESGSEPSGDGVWGRLLHHAATLRPVAMETASS